MTWYGSDIIKAFEILPVFEKIHDEHLDILKISCKGDYEISASDQFYNIYKGRVLQFTDIEEAKKSFLIIFYDNLHHIEKLKNLEAWKFKLLDENSWADITETNNSSEGTQNNTSNTVSKDKSKSGSTDSNSYIDEDTNNKWLEVEEEQTPIPAKNITQNTSINNNNNTGSNDSTSKMTGKMTRSNPSQDYLNLINLTLPQLRREFWRLFTPLFL